MVLSVNRELGIAAQAAVSAPKTSSIVGDDEYAHELGYTTRPSQIILGCSAKRFPTFIYTLDML